MSTSPAQPTVPDLDRLYEPDQLRPALVSAAFLLAAVGVGLALPEPQAPVRMPLTLAVVLNEAPDFAPPPPPPPSPAGGGRQIPQAQDLLPLSTVVPVPVTPTTLPTQPSPVPEPVSATPGVAGGVPGGQAGGVPGGVVGGTPGGVAGGKVGGVLGGTGTVLTPPRFDAAYLNNPVPAYPTLSRRLGETGRVVLRVLVSPSGLAEQLEIKSSSGFARLDQAALEAVRRWRFVPARSGEAPIGAWVLVPLTFDLNA